MRVCFTTLLPSDRTFPNKLGKKGTQMTLVQSGWYVYEFDQSALRLAGRLSRTLHLLWRSLKQGIVLQRNTSDSLLSSRLDSAMDVFAFTDASIHRLLREILHKTFQISYFKSKTGSNYSYFLVTKSYHNHAMKAETKIKYRSLFPHVGQRAVGKKQIGTLREGTLRVGQ